MDADLIALTLKAIRAELPEVPEEIWARLERNLRQQHGGRDHWVARRAKRNRLGELEAALQANADASAAELAHKLGISVRRCYQLMELIRPGE